MHDLSFTSLGHVSGGVIGGAPGDPRCPLDAAATRPPGTNSWGEDPSVTSWDEFCETAGSMAGAIATLTGYGALASHTVGMTTELSCRYGNTVWGGGGSAPTSGYDGGGAGGRW